MGGHDAFTPGLLVVWFDSCVIYCLLVPEKESFHNVCVCVGGSSNFKCLGCGDQYFGTDARKQWKDSKVLRGVHGQQDGMA